MKDILFLSHANPEDNEFTRWLALQLTRQGYTVWCDLVDLLGGEDFWKDIEKVLRRRSIKFLYVLSRTSNTKPGPLNELQVAQNVMRDEGLQDFIVPLLIDDLPPREINIQLSRINAISFNESWAIGLHQLFERLKKDATPTNPNLTPDVVATWWKNHYSADSGITLSEEEHLSNWFLIEQLPDKIYFHALRRTDIGLVEVPSDLPYPGFQHNRYLVSFAPAKDFEGHLGTSLFIDETFEFPLQDLLDGKVLERFVPKDKRRDFVVRLLKQGFWKFAESKKLKRYALSQHTLCWWFPKDLIPKDKITFVGVDGKNTWRLMVGYKTRKKPDGNAFKQYWHFGIQARPIFYPNLAFVIKYHVMFSDDGIQHWRSKKRIHRARRRQCRGWWNSDWRDRTLAAMQWLADGKENMSLQLGSEVVLAVKAAPVSFLSDVSYSDPQQGLAANDIEEDEEIEQTEFDEFDDEEDDESDEEA